MLNKYWKGCFCVVKNRVWSLCMRVCETIFDKSSRGERARVLAVQKKDENDIMLWFAYCRQIP